MLAKLTSKNQLSLPKAVVNSVGNSEYYDIEVQAGKIILTPVRVQHADAVREKLKDLKITDKDIKEAIEWARK
jgi:hypothetical protein